MIHECNHEEINTNMEQLKKLFKNLDLLIKERDELMRTCPEVWAILIKKSGIFVGRHIPFELGELITLWTNGSKWKIHNDGDTIYIFAIATPDKYDIKIEAYGWSKNKQEPVVVKGLSYTQMADQAFRVGVRPQPSNTDIDKGVEKFKTFLAKTKRK